jgi:hypothetical protein
VIEDTGIEDYRERGYTEERINDKGMMKDIAIKDT